MSTLMSSLARLPEGMGGTFDPMTGEAISRATGFQVADPMHPSAVISSGNVPTDRVANVARAAHAIGAAVGAWHDPETGNVEIEVSQYVEDRDRAVALGHEMEQVSIWDWAQQAELFMDRQPANA